jgi:hypothetical protein
LDNFGLIDIKSQRVGKKSVPAVSMVRWCRPVARISESGINSANNIGSPPVITTCEREYPRTISAISSIDRSSPSGSHDVNGVSQKRQRRLQPDALTKTLGVPHNRPSPCFDE